jgi:pyrroline-5-carboxylate reductase
VSALPRLGFIGVGTIAAALITGMCAGGEQRGTFLLSPRNADIAKRLAERFSFVEVAADNQSVIDGSDVVFLAVRPQVAADVLGPLKFRRDQRIVSLIATFDVARLGTLVAPASAIARAAPLPTVAQRLGPLTLYPPVPEIARLLAGLGQLIQLEHESDLEAFWAVTGLMASYFGWLDEIAGWLTRHDLEETQVRAFVAAMFESLAVTGAERSSAGFDQLILEHSTPGGLNEQAYRELKAAGWTSLISRALDLVHARILGRATLADRLPCPADQHDSQVSFKR